MCDYEASGFHGVTAVARQELWGLHRRSESEVTSSVPYSMERQDTQERASQGGSLDPLPDSACPLMRWSSWDYGQNGTWIHFTQPSVDGIGYVPRPSHRRGPGPSGFQEKRFGLYLKLRAKVRGLEGPKRKLNRRTRPGRGWI